MTVTEPAIPDITAAALTDELASERRRAARAYDRATALADLRLRLLEAGHRSGRAVTLAELFAAAERRGEPERAELAALCFRITGDAIADSV